jgi:hypothetical protein
MQVVAYIDPDLPTVWEKRKALASFVLSVLQKHDGRYVVEEEGQTTIEGLEGMDSAMLKEIVGDPIRYCLISTQPSTPANLPGNRNAAGAPRLTQTRFMIELWCEEEGASDGTSFTADAFERTLESRDPERVGLHTALQHTRVLPVGNYRAMVQDLTNTMVMRGGFGLSGVPVHLYRTTVTII